MKGTVCACSGIPSHAWPKRSPQMETGRKRDFVKSKTSWTSLTQIPSLLCPSATCFWSLCTHPLTRHQTLTVWPHCRHGCSWPFPYHTPKCAFLLLCICLRTHFLSSWDFVKWIFSAADTSLWIHHKRWHFSRARCFWKNILDECQTRLHKMSRWLSRETCQELGWVKIATARCGCEESKDHRDKNLFVFKIIISKWFWAWRMHRTGRRESARSASDARGRRQRRAADGMVGEAGASDPSPTEHPVKLGEFL